MALKNLFDMVKADKYTADGREAIIKAQEEETEDKVYQIGEISQKTGLQKTANGWVKPKSGKQPGAKKPDESARIAASKEARAKKSQELGQKAAGDFAKYKDLPPVQRKDALGAASHEGISIGMTQRSMEGMGWDLIQADDKVNVYGKPDGSKATMKHDGKKITEVSYEAPGEEPGPDRDDSPERAAYERELSRQQAQRAADDPRGFGYEEPPMEPAAENKTTIRQGPNTKTLNETPAEHVQKNLDAYTGYSPYDMEELVLKPSGYEKSRSTKGPDGVSSITYKKDGGDDIILFFDKYGELKNAGTSQNREGVMQKMRAAEGYGHMKVVGDYDVYRVTSGPDKGKYKVSKVGSLREVTMSEEKAADFLTSAAGKNKAANKDSAPRVLTGDTKIRVRKA